MNKKLLSSIFTEYKISYAFFRCLYSIKLKTLKLMPNLEFMFEKKVNVKKIELFNLDVEALQKFLNNLDSKEKNKIIHIADDAVDGTIFCFSNKKLGYGNPIQWDYNPITKAKCGYKKWFLIPDFDKKIGDIKYVWEASRLTHFYYFARAYLITKNRKYYEAFSSQLNRWLQKNQYSYGPNYKCGQECAIRMLNVLLVSSVFNKKNLLSDLDRKNIKKVVEGSYKKILSNFFYAYRCIRNNHTLSEIAGMIAGAWCCEDDKQLNKAFLYFEKTIIKQFTRNGGYIQNSVNYQRFALQIVEIVQKMNDEIKFKMKEDINKRLAASINLLFQLQNDIGYLPNYGSNDGALIFPVSACDYRDFRPCLNSLYNRFTGYGLYKPSNADEENLWFGNHEITKRREIKKKGFSFLDAGIHSIRHKNITAILFVQSFSHRPAHMDQMHIDIWYKNNNIFCDSGTFSYYEEDGRKLVLTEAHNTLHIYGKEQMDIRSPFFIYNWSKCLGVQHKNTFIKAVMESKNGYIHSRGAEIRNDSIIVTDDIKGEGTYELLYHTPYKVELANKHKCKFYYTTDENSTKKQRVGSLSISNGRIEIKETYRSLYYGKKDKIQCIHIIPDGKKCITYISFNDKTRNLNTDDWKGKV